MGPYMEFLKFGVVESAPNTYTEREQRCPTSKTELMAMLIHDLWVALIPCETIDATITKIDYQITKHSMTGISYWIHPDVLLCGYISREAGFVSGLLSNYVFSSQLAFQHLHFDPAVLYPGAVIYGAVKGAAQVAAKALDVVVGYTLERVSREDFIAALVE